MGRLEAVVIHVTFCASGASSLRKALGIRDQRRKVVDLNDELSWGPIHRKDFRERETWLKLNLPWDPNSEIDVGGWDWIASGAEDFQSKVASSEEHLVWVAPQNADELCGLHWYLDRFGGRRASFIIADHGLPGTWRGDSPKGISELGPEQFQFLLKNAVRHPWDEHRFPQSRWSQLCDDSTNLRLVRNGEITSATDDFFDSTLLAQCSKNWRKLHRVVADTMIALWELEHYNASDLIMWRLRVLASQRVIVTSREITAHYHSLDDPNLIRLA